MLNSASQVLQVPGPAGGIDTTLDLPNGAVRGVAVIAHPHPLYGGTRENKVVQTLARALLALGYVCWSPNFRGVGNTEGTHDGGNGESEDLHTLLKFALAHESAQTAGAAPAVVLAGFSFGSFVQTLVYQRLLTEGLQVERIIMVGAAVSRFKVPKMPPGTLVIHGEVDDVVPLADVLRWAESCDLPVTVIPGADHFFHRKLGLIKQLVLQTAGPLTVQ